MCRLEALRLALDLRHVPSRVHHLREQSLPEGIPFLLRIAAGEPDAERKAAEMLDRPLAEIREAAGFFIEQILLAPNASSYRVLGSKPEASSAELRRNMALLMRWLHPDLEKEADRSVFAGRVTSAWDDLKTPERRAAYDSRLVPAGYAPIRSTNATKKRPAKRRRGGPFQSAPGGGGRWLMPRPEHQRSSLLVRLFSLFSGRRSP